MKGALNAMSTTLKDADYTKTSPFEKSFQHKRKVNDPRFGNISIMQNPQSRELLAVREIKEGKKDLAGQLILNCRKRVANKHPNLLNLKDYSVTKQSELCSSFYIIKEFYEYPKSDIKREIMDRTKRGETFDDKELTHILYQQIQANSYLQAKGQSHGDIQPLHIGYNKDEMSSKLIDLANSPANDKMQKNLLRNKVKSKNNLYMSPKMFENLSKGNLNFNTDAGKEDAFGLALTLLESGNGDSVQDCYNKTNGTFDKVALQKHVDNFNNKFGHENTLLSSTVASMANPNEEERPDFRTLETSMPDYEEVKGFLNSKTGTKVNTSYPSTNNQVNLVQNNKAEKTVNLPNNVQVNSNTNINTNNYNNAIPNTNNQQNNFNSNTNFNKNTNFNDINESDDFFNFDFSANPYYHPSKSEVPLEELDEPNPYMIAKTEIPIQTIPIRETPEFNNNFDFNQQMQRGVQSGIPLPNNNQVHYKNQANYDNNYNVQYNYDNDEDNEQYEEPQFQNALFKQPSNNFVKSVPQIQTMQTPYQQVQTTYSNRDFVPQQHVNNVYQSDRVIKNYENTLNTTNTSIPTQNQSYSQSYHSQPQVTRMEPEYRTESYNNQSYNNHVQNQVIRLEPEYRTESYNNQSYNNHIQNQTQVTRLEPEYRTENYNNQSYTNHGQNQTQVTRLEPEYRTENYNNQSYTNQGQVTRLEPEYRTENYNNQSYTNQGQVTRLEPEYRTENYNNQSYTNHGQNQTQTQVIRMEPEYRTEYINRVDKDAESRRLTAKYNNIPLSEFQTNQLVETEKRVSKTIISDNYDNQFEKVVSSNNLYSNNNLSYTTTPHIEAYVTNNYTNTYNNPTQVVEQGVSHTLNSTPAYNGNHYEQPRIVEKRVSHNPNTFETTNLNGYVQSEHYVSTNYANTDNSFNTGGLKLLRTYEDPKYAS